MHPCLAAKLNLASRASTTLCRQFQSVKSKTCISHSRAVATTSSSLLRLRAISIAMAILGPWKLKEVYLLREILALVCLSSKQKRSLRTRTEKVSVKTELWPLRNTVKWRSHTHLVMVTLTINS